MTPLHISNDDVDAVQNHAQEIDASIADTSVLIKEFRTRWAWIMTELETPERKFLDAGKVSVAFEIILSSWIRVIHKLSDDPHQSPNEVRGTRMAEQAGVHAPHVLYNTDRSVTETFIEWTSHSHQAIQDPAYIRVYADLGRQLARLHSQPGKWFWTHEHGKWMYENKEVFLQNGIQQFDQLGSWILTETETRAISQILKKDIPSEDQILLHGDIHVGNMRVNLGQWKLMWLIDFGGIKTWPVELEFISLYKVQQMFPHDLPVYDITRDAYEKESWTKLDHELVQQLMLARSCKYFKNPKRYESTKRIIHSIINS